MLLLDEIRMPRTQQGPAVIQLLQGDLSALPPEHAADILIISAYPGSYIPVPKTLIAALDDKGLSVAALAAQKAIDLRDQLGCWLSEPLAAAQQAQFNFKKILCFEPWHQATDQAAVISNIFRCINTFAFNENNNVIAMPVLASGKQKVPFEKMLPAMLDASIFWLESGLPLQCIKLVVFSESQAAIALPVFTRARQQNEMKQSARKGTITGVDALKMLNKQKEQGMPGEAPMQIVVAEITEMADKETQQQHAAGLLPPEIKNPDAKNQLAGPQRPAFDAPPSVAPAASPDLASASPVVAATPATPVPDTQYDYFISYAHKHAAEVDRFVSGLTGAAKNLRVFYDKSTIPTGGIWIKQISDAIQKSKKVLIFLSPDYSNSPVCWDEFQCAKLMEYNSKKQLIQTIYLYNDVAMPPIMGIYSWADCREGDNDKLQQTALQMCNAII